MTFEEFAQQHEIVQHLKEDFGQWEVEYTIDGILMDYLHEYASEIYTAFDEVYSLWHKKLISERSTWQWDYQLVKPYAAGDRIRTTQPCYMQDQHLLAYPAKTEAVLVEEDGQLYVEFGIVDLWPVGQVDFELIEDAS